MRNLLRTSVRRFPLVEGLYRLTTSCRPSLLDRLFVGSTPIVRHYQGMMCEWYEVIPCRVDGYTLKAVRRGLSNDLDIIFFDHTVEGKIDRFRKSGGRD